MPFTLNHKYGVKHGMWGFKEYWTWHNMNRRCRGNKLYKNINVCKQWSHDFTQFYKDMGPQPDNTSLDRIDNNGDYTPSNCRWASKYTQSQNQRTMRDTVSGIRGIGFDNNRKKWIVRISFAGQRQPKYIGRFETKEEAINARKQAELKYWGFNP